jgi:hypothetical protein
LDIKGDVWEAIFDVLLAASGFYTVIYLVKWFYLRNKGKKEEFIEEAKKAKIK